MERGRGGWGRRRGRNKRMVEEGGEEVRREGGEGKGGRREREGGRGRGGEWREGRTGRKGYQERHSPLARSSISSAGPPPQRKPPLPCSLPLPRESLPEVSGKKEVPLPKFLSEKKKSQPKVEIFVPKFYSTTGFFFQMF
jgi:hypothetical protein